jgi:hypothetical protein
MPPGRRPVATLPEIWQAETMARGWESKSIESQIESTSERTRPSAAAQITAEQINRQREREGLELSKTRVIHDLEKAVHPQYREQLQAALRHLEARIAALD